MKRAAERIVQARMARLADVIGFVEGLCRQHGIGRADLLRLTLVVEELFTNTVEHGYGGDCDAPVRLELSATATEVTLLYEDAAPPFDALVHLAQQPPSVDMPLATRPIGGLGLHLVEQIAASARYAREDGRNRLWIVLRRAA
jgi:serine/threonine-protein kinase RsbW